MTPHDGGNRTGAGGVGTGGAGTVGTGGDGTGGAGRTGTGGAGTGGASGVGTGGAGTMGTGTGGAGRMGTGGTAPGGGGAQGGSGGTGTPASDSDCDGGYLDITSSLCWQQPPDETRRTLQEATNYCDALDLAGQSNWRVPTIDEARSLVRDCAATALDGECPIRGGSPSTDLVADCYGCDAMAGRCRWSEQLSGDCTWFHWSSSPVADYPGEGAWFLYYFNGSVNWESVQEQFMVRCVRDAS